MKTWWNLAYDDPLKDKARDIARPILKLVGQTFHHGPQSYIWGAGMIEAVAQIIYDKGLYHVDPLP